MMKIYVVVDDYAGVPMECFLQREDAEDYVADKFANPPKLGDPISPVIYTRILRVQVE
jgi:hypothetical protein